MYSNKKIEIEWKWTIKLIISNGKIVKIHGKQKKILKKIYDNQKNDKSKIIGEFGIGLNPNAKISGIMLVDEGIRGTIHFGMGLSTEGGNNNIPFHLDHIILKPNVTVAKKKIIRNGKILLWLSLHIKTFKEFENFLKKYQK